MLLFDSVHLFDSMGTKLDTPIEGKNGCLYKSCLTVFWNCFRQYAQADCVTYNVYIQK